MKRQFNIFALNAGVMVGTVSAGNGKHALAKFGHLYNPEGAADLKKVMGRWMLCSSGRRYIAKEVRI